MITTKSNEIVENKSLINKMGPIILEKEQFISVDYNTMFEKIRNNYKRYNGHPNGDFYRNLQVLKLRLSGRKEVQIKVNIQERYNIEGNELFLLSI